MPTLSESSTGAVVSSLPKMDGIEQARSTALKERERDDHDDEIALLKSKVGEITMDNELLYAKIEALEGKRPLAHRRSRR